MTKIYYPKPEILQLVPERGHVLIAASAGTGKTYTLEHLVVDLLLGEEDIELEQILVVTFTEKATSELKVRVRRLIKTVLDAVMMSARNPNSPYLEPLDPERSPHWEIGEDERRKLEKAHLSFDIAPIYTIHAFCQKILTEYAFANQRMFDQQHVEFNQLFDRAFTDTMRRTLARDSELQDWLESWLEVSKVEELQQMMAQAVTSRAEIWPRFREDRVLKGLERFGDDLWERYREVYRRRCDKREQAMRRAQKEWIATRSVPRFLMHADPEMTDFKHSLRESQISNEEQHDFLKFTVALLRFKPAVVQKFLPIMSDALEREKQRTGAYTFDDMLEMLWKSLSSEGSTAPWLVKTLRRRYRYALIDEFQDTDEIQWKIFRKLFTQSSSDRERLFVIGDPKQAIYGFRNADVHTYLDAQNELLDFNKAANDNVDSDEDAHSDSEEQSSEEPAAHLQQEHYFAENAALLRLHYNYRSTHRLITAYNAIFDQRAASPFFSSKEINYLHPVRCGDTSRKLLDYKDKEPPPIIIGQMKRRENEQHKSSRMNDLYECYGKWIADEIKSILSDEGALFFERGGKKERIQARDIFVLTRTRSDEYRLEKHLRDAQIPFTFVRQESLFDSPQAQHVYDLLRAIERPRERGRRLRAWSTPFFDIDLDELTRCREISESHTLYKNLLHWHVLAKEQRFEELFTDILERSGLVRREIFFSEDNQDLADYNQLFDVLLEEAHLGRCDVHELVARMRAFIEKKKKPLVQHGDIRRVEEREDAVQLLTMHKSKGLEAPVVFLFAFGGMGGDSWRFHYQNRQGDRIRALHIHKPEQKISPRLRDRVEAEDRQESERLFYVALTRAMARLYIPFIPYIGDQPCCKSMAQRSYNVLNERLKAMLPDIEQPIDIEDENASTEGANENKEAFKIQELIELRDIPYFGIQPTFNHEDHDTIAALQKWAPPTRWVVRHSYEEELAHEDMDKIQRRVQHLESYSSLKRKAGGYQTHDLPMDEQELMADAELGSGDEDIVSEEELPGGVRTGLFLHAMLEDLDYSTLTRYQGVDEWRDDPKVQEVFMKGFKEYGLEPQYKDLAQRMIWRALTATVEVAHGVIYGLGHCIPNIRELEFLYPIEHTPPLQSNLFSSQKTKIEPGFIKGYIDYTFEWQDRVYFADWKSDVLDRYSEQNLKQHFEANYTKQAFLYTVALCKMFDIDSEQAFEQRFGGAVYCFLRGMQEDSRTGLVSWRPTWSEVIEFKENLLNHNQAPNDSAHEDHDTMSGESAS